MTCRTHSALVGDVGLLRVAGEVDLCAAPALRHAFAGLFTDGARTSPGRTRAGARDVVVDLAEVTRRSSSCGLRTVAQTWNPRRTS